MLNNISEIKQKPKNHLKLFYKVKQRQGCLLFEPALTVETRPLAQWQQSCPLTSSWSTPMTAQVLPWMGFFRIRNRTVRCSRITLENCPLMLRSVSVSSQPHSFCLNTIGVNLRPLGAIHSKCLCDVSDEVLYDAGESSCGSFHWPPYCWMAQASSCALNQWLQLISWEHISTQSSKQIID